MNSIFKRSVELNMKIEKFLDTISNSLMLFDKMIKLYLENDCDAFEDTFNRITELETEADNLEVEIKTTLYKYMLLPDTRADVLSLVKSLDNIIDATEEITKEFHIQKPKIPECFHKEIKYLCKHSIDSAESLLNATRAFFNEVHLVNAHINKINFYEHEADILEAKINYSIFNDGCVDSLAEKLQLKYFISKITSISDEAETVGEKLTVFTIKREI